MQNNRVAKRALMFPYRGVLITKGSLRKTSKFTYSINVDTFSIKSIILSQFMLPYEDVLLHREGLSRLHMKLNEI